MPNFAQRIKRVVRHRSEHVSVFVQELFQLDQHILQLRRKPCPKNRVEEHVEKAVVEIALEKPAFGQVRVANELTKHGLFVSPTGVRSVWLRHDLETFRKRLKALEAKAAQEHLILTEEQLRALERAREEKEAHGEIETLHPGYLGTQDTYYVGTIKSVGRIYQQTFLDTYAKVAFAKLYDRKNALVAADLLNDRVLPFFEEHECVGSAVRWLWHITALPYFPPRQFP